MLQRCLDQHDGFCDGHLLMAEICLHMKAPKMAESSLEKALSHSFDVCLYVCQCVTMNLIVYYYPKLGWVVSHLYCNTGIVNGNNSPIIEITVTQYYHNCHNDEIDDKDNGCYTGPRKPAV